MAEHTSERVKQILSWYPSDNPGTLANLARLLMTGTLAGTGKLVILPVDQGFEHGPARSFAPNPAGYDPDYHVQLAIDAGLQRLRGAARLPRGGGAAKYAGQIPLILKLNNSDTLSKLGDAPISAVTGSVKDALRLGCTAIGYTIYPGSDARNDACTRTSASITRGGEGERPGRGGVGYPRGSGLSKEGETAVDVAAYAAQIAAQLGAHIIKVKPPKDRVEQPEAKKVYEEQQIPIEDPGRARPPRRAVARSTASASSSSRAARRRGPRRCWRRSGALEEGGAFGSIMGRNAFQRPKAEALKLLADVMRISRGRPDRPSMPTAPGPR